MNGVRRVAQRACGDFHLTLYSLKPLFLSYYLPPPFSHLLLTTVALLSLTPLPNHFHPNRSLALSAFTTTFLPPTPSNSRLISCHSFLTYSSPIRLSCFHVQHPKFTSTRLRMPSFLHLSVLSPSRRAKMPVNSSIGFISTSCH